MQDIDTALRDLAERIRKGPLDAETQRECALELTALAAEYAAASREWGVRLPNGNVLGWGSEADGESKARRAAAMSVTFPGGAHTLVSRYRGEWTEVD